MCCIAISAYWGKPWQVTIHIKIVHWKIKCNEESAALAQVSYLYMNFLGPETGNMWAVEGAAQQLNHWSMTANEHSRTSASVCLSTKNNLLRRDSSLPFLPEKHRSLHWNQLPLGSINYYRWRWQTVYQISRVLMLKITHKWKCAYVDRDNWDIVLLSYGMNV